MALLQAVFLALLVPCVLGGIPACTGRLIGSLPTLFHGVSGNLYVRDERTFCISDFNYDGRGPDAFLYFYYPGDSISDIGGGVYSPLNAERTQFQGGRPYVNETLWFMLPENKYRACDFEGFGIWCRYANQLFTSISWNNDQIFGTDPDPIMCTASPGRAYVGELPTLDHNVGGHLYVRDNKTLVIRDFTYDGQAPDAFVYWYPPGVEVDPTGGGQFIPLPSGEEEGRFGNTVYTGLPQSDFVITIPDDMDVFTCDMEKFTIWCRMAAVFFTTITVDGELFTNNPLERAYRPDRIFCDRPTTRPGVYVGELPTTDPRAISGTFYVRDQWTFTIQLFSYDASREDTFLYYYPIGVTPGNTGEGGIKISFSNVSVALPVGRSNSYFNQDFVVDLTRALGGSVRACDVGHFAVFDMAATEQITVIAIPQDIFSAEGEMGKILCGDVSTTPTAGSTAGATPAHSTLGVFGALAAVLLAYII